MDIRFIRFEPKHRFPSVPAVKAKETPVSPGRGLILGPTMVADELLKLGIRMDGFDPHAHSSYHQELNARFDALFERQPSTLKYECPQHPLEIEIAEESGLKIPDEMLELLLCCVAWEIEPPFLGEGRSGWVAPRTRLVSLDDFHASIGAFKLKGVGAYDENVVCPPRDQEFFHGERLLGKGIGRLQTLIHMGIRDDGSLFPVVDPPKPIGGMKLSRARAEFENARQLLNHGMPAVKPIAYGKYSGLTWEGEPMGFVILGTTLKESVRIGDYFESVYDGAGQFVGFNPLLRQLVERRFEVLRPGNLVYPAMRTVCELALAIGKTLRSFHNAGLCRFAGHTGNFQYIVEIREAHMHDLDSSVKIDSLAGRARGLSIIRDIESVLFGFLHSVLHSEVYRLCSRETIDKCNPFYALLQGYFGSEIADQVVAETGRDILNHFLDNLQTMPRYGSPQFLFWFTEFSMSFTSGTMERLMPVFSRSALGQAYPLPYGSGPDFEKRMERYWEEARRLGQINSISQFFRS